MIFVPVIVLVVVGLVLILRPWPFFMTSEQSREYFERNVAYGYAKWVEKKALELGLSVRGVARHMSLQCPKCGKPSNYFVYPDDVCDCCWRASLKNLSTHAKQHPS